MSSSLEKLNVNIIEFICNVFTFILINDNILFDK